MPANVTVEVHPFSAFMPPELRRWRVLVDGEQNSVHETEQEAQAAAQDCRARLATAWTRPRGGESRTGSVKEDWKK